MSNILEKLAKAGHLSDEQIEKVNQRVQAFMKAAQADPKLAMEAQEKLGGVWDGVSGAGKRFMSGTAERIPGAAANLVALGLVGGAAGVASDAYKSVREGAAKAKAYNTMMMEAGDRLEGIPPKQIQQSFNTLYSTNPNYGQDPVVAAEFVRETSRSEAYPFQLLKMVGDSTGRGQAPSIMDYSKLLPPMKTEPSRVGRGREMQDASTGAGLPVKGGQQAGPEGA